ncbi:unnamed protein product [Leptidea sinapis]|uniref:unspecific monooxygenase n=1 Tax=Leptidea sinapis TaxID=189913 RepID=A0A5E4R355_9NEOP|nr:unnamed protein product [Leptidea sinapis]
MAWFLVQWFSLSVLLFLTLFYLYMLIVFQYWKNRGVVYEVPTFPLGNIGFMMRKSFWDYFYELWQRHPRDYVGIFMGWKPVFIVQSPELAKQILVKDHEYFQNRYLYSGYSDPLGSLNIFTVKNPIWSSMRHELSPMFTSLRLKTITELMNINAQQLVAKIKRDYIDGNKIVDLKDLFTMYTSDTVAYSVFGIRASALNGQKSPLWTITSHMVKFTLWRGLEFTMIFVMPAVAAFLRLKLFSAEANEYIKEIFWNVVNERKTTGKTTDKDLVNHLLKLKENLKLPVDTDTELADNLMIAQAAVFILGSVETSSTTLSYCLHELAYHPEAQEKLYSDIDNALNESGKNVLEYDDLINLKYLSACIYETLRKYPPVTYLDRVCNKTYKLNDEVTIEKGIPVLVNVVGIHHNEKLYPQPEVWNPERNESPTSDNDNIQYTFLPFGDGPRFCIGKRYGLMQIRTALAQIVHKYKLEPTFPHKVAVDPYAMILSPEDGLSVKFVSRAN